MKNKIGTVLIIFIIIMFGLFGYLIYTKINPSNGKYIAETELKDISIDNELVKRAINTLSFSYQHDQTDLENKLYNGAGIQVDQLSNEDKLLLIINDLSNNNKLPKPCTSNYAIFDKKYIESSIIKDLKFLDKLTNKEPYQVGPYKVDYNEESIMVTNSYCKDEPLEYEKIIPIEAKKSNKRLVITIKYIYIEENIDEEEVTYYKTYKTNNKTEVINENYTEEETNLEPYNTYEVTFNIAKDNIYFKEISKK